jgi:hypothetical protein
MTLLTPNETIALNAGEIYSLPSYPVLITAAAQVQTSILQAGPFANVSNGLVTGCFLKSATNTTIKLQKNIVYP